MTWDEAEAMAVREGGHLATIRNLNENNWLAQQFSPPVAGATAPYIGFSDAAVEGQWVWSSGEFVTYTNWNLPTSDECGGDPAQTNWQLEYHPLTGAAITVDLQSKMTCGDCEQ
jgi:hypothetical protein